MYELFEDHWQWLHIFILCISNNISYRFGARWRRHPSNISNANMAAWLHLRNTSHQDVLCLASLGRNYILFSEWHGDFFFIKWKACNVRICSMQIPCKPSTRVDMSSLEDEPAPSMHIQALTGIPTRTHVLISVLIKVKPWPVVEGPINLTKERPQT